MNLGECQIILEREHKEVIKIHTAMRKVSMDIHVVLRHVDTEVQLSNEFCNHWDIRGCFFCFYDVKAS